MEETNVMKKAGVMVRLFSYIIDSIIIFIICMGVAISILTFFGVGTSNMEIGIPVIILYYTYFFGRGQTPGMEMLKIKLCRTDGTYPVGFARGFIRSIVMLVSEFIFYLGFFWILIDEDKQGWHDKAADTYVIVK